MEDTTRSPKPNEFIIPENEGYAKTEVETGTAAEFLMTKLEPVDFEHLISHDRICAICRQEFCIAKDVKVSHAPVKLVCGHVFGENCIIKWLDPLSFWGLVEKDSEFEVGKVSFEIARTSCPICRRVFFPEYWVEPMQLLAHCLDFWDTAYACAGVSRSVKEEHSRKYLWEYVEYCRSIDEHEISIEWSLELDHYVQWLFGEFVQFLKKQKLTREQEELRRKLEQIGRKNLKKCAIKNGLYVFDLDRDDDERIEFEHEPLQ